MLCKVVFLKCYSLVIDPKLVKQIDSLIKEHGLYSSRSDFIRDAIRARLIEVKKMVLGKYVEEDIGLKEREEKWPKKKKGGKGKKEEEAVEEAMEEIDDEHKYGGVH